MLNVNFPVNFSALLSLLSVIFLDIRKLILLDCISLGGFYSKFMLKVVVMPGSMFGIVALIFLKKRRAAGNADDAETAQAMRADARHSLYRHGFTVILLAYPQVSQTLFRAFSCRELADGESWHESDYTIDCTGAGYISFAFLATILIGVSVIIRE